MSSPIANQKRSVAKRLLISSHQALSHNRRVRKLSVLVSEQLKSLYSESARINCIDIGCGDMQIAEEITKHMPNSYWLCYDIHPLPSFLQNSERWKKYRVFDGENIPLSNKSVDVALLCDVLHHAGESAGKLLSEAARVARYVVVKDHFEYSTYSRWMLKLMDFVGNWGYNIPLPRRYFSPERFSQLCTDLGLKQEKMIVGIDLYNHLPIVKKILNPNWQFLAVMTSY